jgi:DNA adenine methylase
MADFQLNKMTGKGNRSMVKLNLDIILACWEANVGLTDLAAQYHTSIAVLKSELIDRIGRRAYEAQTTLNRSAAQQRRWQHRRRLPDLDAILAAWRSGSALIGLARQASVSYPTLRKALIGRLGPAAFGGKGGTGDCHFGYGTTGRGRFNRTSLAALNKCHKRLDGVTIENTDWPDLVKRYDRPHTFFYCDPPYLETAGYASEFGLADHAKLAQVLRGIEGKYLLSINDHPAIRNLYKGLTIRPIQTTYTVSRDKSAAAAERGELLIANYKLPRRI